MNKFALRGRYLLSMFFLSLNSRELNFSFTLQLISDLIAEELVWREILDPEEFYGEDENQYMDFIERGGILHVDLLYPDYPLCQARDILRR